MGVISCWASTVKVSSGRTREAGWGTSRLDDLAICQGGRATGGERNFCQIPR